MYQGVIMAGFGGQGVISGGILLAYSGMVDSKYVTFFPAYGAEMRGGTANCSVVISSEEIASPVVAFPDSLLVMNEPSLTKFEPTLHSKGVLFLSNPVPKEMISKLSKFPLTILQKKLAILNVPTW